MEEFTQEQLTNAWHAHQLNNSIDLDNITSKGYAFTYETECYEDEDYRNANANKGQLRYEDGLKVLKTHRAIARTSSECDATIPLHPNDHPSHDNWIRAFGVLRTGGTSHFVVEFVEKNK